MMLKVFSILMLFMGEALCIYSEMLVAKEPRWWWTFLLITIAGIPLLLGYHYGYKAFESMWVVMVVSIVSILIVEPILVLAMFKEAPTPGTVVGFILGCAGFYFATAY
jgi:uncharacterized membrane protein